jgi:uncharacterized lipoprotein YehR (DUF1307 family)
MSPTSNFKGTKEVYGVDPKELADMSYKKATRLKYEYAKAKKKEIVKKMFSNSQMPYEEVSKLNMELNKIEKAIELAELQLEEIGEKV